jgi:hypothetical protein
LSLRQKYFVAASAGFILLGLIIVIRAALAATPVIAILGVVLISLGIIRLRDFRNYWRGTRDS